MNPQSQGYRIIICQTARTAGTLEPYTDFNIKKMIDDGRMPGPKIVKVLKFSKSGNHRPQVKKIKVLGNQRIAAGGQLKRAKKRLTSVKKSAAD